MSNNKTSTPIPSSPHSGTVMPENKVCRKCKIQKPASEFWKDKSNRDGLQSWCQDCNCENDKKRYKNNIGRYKYLIKSHQDRLRILKQSAKAGGCVICGYKRCVSALEFHHLDTKKKESMISSTQSFRKLQEELSKCIVVCANCHREIHEGLITPETRRGYRLRSTPIPENGQKNILTHIYKSKGGSGPGPPCLLTSGEFDHSQIIVIGGGGA